MVTVVKTESEIGKNLFTNFMDDIDVDGLLRQTKKLLIQLERSEPITPSEQWIESRELIALLDETLLRKKRGIAIIDKYEHLFYYIPQLYYNCHNLG